MTRARHCAVPVLLLGEVDPDERAGGRAIFDTSEDAVPWLLPVEGLYYRLASPRNPHLYYREVTAFENWTVRVTTSPIGGR